MTQKIKAFLHLFCLSFLFSFPNTFADTIYLQNGDHFSGKLINLHATTCLFKTPYQKNALQIKREHILRLSTDEAVIVELYSGERLIGILTSQKNGVLSLHSQKLGIVTIRLSEISSIKSPLTPLFQSGEIKEESPLTPLFQSGEIKEKSSLTPLFQSGEFKEESPLTPLFQGGEFKEKSPLTPLFQRGEFGEFQSIDPLMVRAKGTENLETSDASENSDSSDEHDEDKQVTIGQEDEENLQHIFLRNMAVLLEPGEKEAELFFGYGLDQYADLRYRDLTFLGSLRIGLTNRLEGFLNLPVFWTEQESVSEENYYKNHNFGLGDLSAGFNYLFVVEGKQKPDIIGSIALTMPTAEEPDRLDPNAIALGSGQWHLTTVLNLVKSYDPATLFSSISYTHTFPHTFNDGVRVEPGDSLGFQFGFGFSINYQLSLFSSFSWAYIDETQRDDVKVLGSVREPMSLTVGLSYSLSKHNYLQPSLTFGLNDDAADASLGLSYIRRFE